MEKSDILFELIKQFQGSLNNVVRNFFYVLSPRHITFLLLFEVFTPVVDPVTKLPRFLEEAAKKKLKPFDA